MTYPDLADPQYIIQGNDQLKLGIKNSLNIWYWCDFTKKKHKGDIRRTLSAYIGFKYNNNDVTNSTVYNRTSGAITIKPVNVSANWDGKANIGFTTPLDVAQHFWVETLVETSVLRTKTFSGTITDRNTDMQFNDNRLYSYLASIKPSFKIGTIDLSAAYEMTIEKNKGTYASSNNKAQWQHLLSGKLNWQLPFHLNLNTSFNYHNYASYIINKRKNWFMMNFEIERSFFNKENFFVKISVHDIFKQNNGFLQQYNATALTHTYQNTLGRYGMLTLKYRFSSKKK